MSLRKRRALVLAAAIASAGIFSVGEVSAQDGLLIENVTLIDGTGRPALLSASVLVKGDRITRVSRTAIEAPSGTTRIDGRGKYLIPGLMDMHIHLTGARGPDGLNEGAGIQALHGFLYSGFTSV